MTPPRMRLRIGATDDAELYCWGCHEWLPVSIQFWPARDKLWRCRACESDRQRLYQARKAFDPEWRQKQLTKSARYRAYILGIDPALVEAERAERRERLAAKARGDRSHAASVSRQRAYKAAWKRERREAA